MADRLVVGIEIGGTNVSVALGQNSSFLESTIVSEPVYFKEGDKEFTDQVFGLVKQSMDKTGAKLGDVKFVGIAAAGQPTKEGTIQGAANAPFEMTFPFELVKLGKGIITVNDVLGATFGAKEHGYGATTFKNQGFPRWDSGQTIGTGTNTQLLMNGVPLRSSEGKSYEMGHLAIHDVREGRLCGCGSRGCAEAYIAGAGIGSYAAIRLMEMYHQKYKHDAEALTRNEAIFRETVLRVGFRGECPIEAIIANVKAEDVFNAYKKSEGSDALSKDIIEGAIDDLARYYGILMNALPSVPYVEVFGSIPEKNPWYVERAVAKLKQTPEYHGNRRDLPTQFLVTQVKNLGLKGAVAAAYYGLEISKPK